MFIKFENLLINDNIVIGINLIYFLLINQYIVMNNIFILVYKIKI